MTLYEIPGDAEINRGLVGYWKLDDLKGTAADGIIAHYKMNDNLATTDVIDSKGGNTGVCSVNTDTINGTGKINGDLVFTGSQSVNLGDREDLKLTGSTTYSFWANLTTLDPTEQFTIFYDNKSGDVDGVDIFYDKVAAVFVFKRYDGSGNESVSTIKTDWVAGNWYHLAVTFNVNTNSVQWYVDGAADGSPTVTSIITTYGTYDVIIGICIEAGIDDFRIYDRDLSLAEVQTIYNSNTGTETTELFRVDPVAIDRANFNDGNITGCSNTEGINGLNADAMFFDGVDDEIIGSFSEPLDLTKNGSISCWFYVNANPSSYEYVFSLLTGDQFVGRIRTDGILNFINNDSTWRNANSTSSVLTNSWNHAVFSWTDSSLYIILNGEKSTVTNRTTQFPGEATDFVFGNSRIVSTDFIKGRMQNFRIWNRTLTDGEVSKIARLRL